MVERAVHKYTKARIFIGDRAAVGKPAVLKIVLNIAVIFSRECQHPGAD
jgi:hypothetical protein